ncbi:MAG: PKD domain-containing protein [Acidimicrobiales bacterium]|jgi:hyaluronoglucosaminidase
MEQLTTRFDPSTQGHRTRRARLLGAVAALAAAAASFGVTAGSAAAATSRVIATPAEPTAWILQSPGGSTSLAGIDVATSAVVSTIPIPSSIGDKVGDTAGVLAISPNGKTAYLAVEVGREVVPINLATHVIGKPIKVADEPVSVAVTPNGSRVYELGYVNIYHADVEAIDPSNGSTSKPISVGPLESAGAGGIAITPDGKTVWVSSSENGTVTPITVSTGKAGTPLAVGYFPTSLAVTPNGKTLWVANTGDDDLVPVDLANSTVGKTVKLGGGPDDLSITPNGRDLFAALGAPANGADRVSLSGSNAVTKVKLEDSTKTLVQVDAVAVEPKGGLAFFCAASEGTVAPVDVATAKETAPISLKAGVSAVSAIAITPDQAPTARFTVAIAGRQVSFNASSSSAYFGSIVRYAWTFGDGASSSHGPTTSHTYAKNGKYTVTLTVTDSLGTSTTVVFTGRTVSRNGGPRAEKSEAVTVG